MLALDAVFNLNLLVTSGTLQFHARWTDAERGPAVRARSFAFVIDDSVH
jgi:hypothetical protein